MTQLPSKSYINGLNIDSVERAIVFAGLGLKLAEDVGLKSPDTSIQINPKVDRINSSIYIVAEIPYLSRFYHGSGGKLLGNLRTTTPTTTAAKQYPESFHVRGGLIPPQYRCKTLPNYTVMTKRQAGRNQCY